MSIVMIPESQLVSNLVPVLRTSTIILAVILIGFALVFAYFILGRLVGPVKNLLALMRSVGAGNFDVQVVVDTKDEFSILLHHFNRMNDRIRILIRENYESKLKEKEAEIQALNMQMNPHFLYNTLNVMNWIAIENDQRDLSKMLVNLSKMLHYTSRKHWDSVHLFEEIEWLDSYFYIMSARFEDTFTVQYEITTELYDYTIPRMLFQPFVENAILHGFHDIEKGGRILIKGWIQESEGVRYYEITDNGRGMSQDVIEQILTGASISVGIQNTISRIRMAYGDTYGITIRSSLNAGTSIIIGLPLLTN
jgi:two-component system sensor histidine kinase YesM